MEQLEVLKASTYAPLSTPRSIRLLRIHDGSDIDALACDVNEVSLDAAPAFEALSYTWERDPTYTEGRKENEVPVEVPKTHVDPESKLIIVNGAQFRVTSNLYNALAEFRRMKRGLPLWADQICINQDDDNEKIVQLALMAQIYTMAVRVIVWLGSMSPVRNTALDFIMKLPPKPDVESLKRALSDFSLPEEAANKDKPQRPVLSHLSRSFDVLSAVTKATGEQYRWYAVTRLLRRRWFSRTWTLQELLLASEVLILMGSREVPIVALIDASQRVFDFYANDPLNILASNTAWINEYAYLRRIPELFGARNGFREGERFSLEEYLAVIRLRGVKEPRDKVIAGSALLEKGAAPTVDLKASPIDIFTDFASSLYLSKTGVRALSLVGDLAPRIQGLPSWVPDLTRPLRPEPLGDLGSPKLKFCLPLEGNELRVDGKMVILHGSRLDKIKDVGETAWSWDWARWSNYAWGDGPFRTRSPQRPIEQWGYFFTLLQGLGAVYKPTGEPTIDAFWKTLIANQQSTSDLPHLTWVQSYQYWFAHALWQIRINIAESDSLLTKWAESDDDWLPAFRAEAIDGVEKRLQMFLDMHDKDSEPPKSETPTPSLRTSIVKFAERLWGISDISQHGMWRSAAGETHSVMHDRALWEMVQVYGNAFSKVYDGRRIFLSENGYLGIGPESLQPDDAVCLVAGADYPYILRAVEGQDQTYTLVGEAYIHGLEEGSTTPLEDMQIEMLRLV